MRRWAAALAVALGGCWVGEGEVQRVVDGVVVEPGAIAVTEVEPSYGTSAGGTGVRVSAAPLEGDVEVFFDGIAAEVVEVGDGAVTVLTPPGDPGDADLVVRTRDGEGRAPRAWRYWPDGAGQAGAIGTISWFRWAGDYWEGPTEDEGFAWIGFVEPTRFAYWNLYADDLERCESEYAYSWRGVTFQETGAPELELRFPGGGVVLGADPDGRFTLDDLPGDSWSWDTSYDLVAPETQPPWPSFGAAGFAATPDEFSVFSPAIEGDWAPSVMRDVVLEWSDPGAGDYMLAQIFRYSGDDIVETVRCAMEDDGTFVIPWYTFVDWENAQQLTILIGRVRESRAVLPHDGSSSVVAGITWVVGGASTLE